MWKYNSWDDRQGLLHIVELLSKSCLQLVRLHFNNGIEVYWTHCGYFIKIRIRNYFIKYSRIKPSILIAWIQLIQVNVIRLTINSLVDLAHVKKLALFLNSSVRLFIFCDPNIIPVVKQMASKIIELKCSTDTLNLKGFPKLELEKLIIGNPRSNQTVKFDRIFRHRIKELTLNFHDSYALKKSYISKSIWHTNHVDSLILNLCGVNLERHVLPFLSKFNKCVNNLEMVELRLQTNKEMILDVLFETQLLDIYNQFMEFKQKASRFLKRIILNFNGRISLFGDSTVPSFDWVSHLKQRFKIEGTHFTNHSDSHQTIDLKADDGVFSMNFHVDIEFSEIQEDEPENIIYAFYA